MEDGTPAYRRILLKLSGEALLGTTEFGLDWPTLDRIAGEIRSVYDLGIEIALVVGGGNIFRGISGSQRGMERSTADYMGMLATIMNAVALQDSLENVEVPTRVMSALDLPSLCEPYIRRRAVRHLEKGRVVIFAAGTGNPYFTTDTAAALRANEINAEIILKATKVNGVYDSDPVKNADARMFDQLSYLDVLKKNLGVMDTTAVSLCMDNDLPILVFNLKTEGNILRVARGERIGTKVGG